MATEPVNNSNVNPDTIKVAFDKVNAHFTDYNNPHNVTEAQVLNGKQALLTDGSRSMQNDLDMGGYNITNLTAITSDINLMGHKIYNLNSDSLNVTLYVDTATGNDNNDGSSSAPLATLKTAVDRIPTGGMGIINLTDGQLFQIMDDITAINKVVYITSTTGATIKNLAFDNGTSTSSTYGFNVLNSKIVFNQVTIETPDAVAGEPFNDKRGFIKHYDNANGTVQFISCNITINNSELIYAGQLSHFDIIFLDGSVTQNATAPLLLIENTTVSFTANNVSLGGLSWSNLITGIVRDGSNIPRNVVSNIVL